MRNPAFKAIGIPLLLLCLSLILLWQQLNLSSQDVSLKDLQSHIDTLQTYEDLVANQQRYQDDLQKIQSFLKNPQTSFLQISSEDQAHQSILNWSKTFLKDTEPNILMNYSFNQEKSSTPSYSIIHFQIEFLCQKSVFFELLKDLEYGPFSMQIEDMHVENKSPRGFYGTMNIRIPVQFVTSNQAKDPA